VLAASDLAQSLGGNRNLALPEYPRLIGDLVRVRDSLRSLVLFGTSTPRLLGGRSVEMLSERLLPLLDGSRHRDVLCGAVARLAPAHVLDALYFLYSEGVLVDGAQRPTTSAGHFFERYCGIRRNRRNGAEIEQALAGCRVLLCGDAAQFDDIDALLREAGGLRAQRCAIGDLAAAAGQGDLILLAGMVHEPADVTALAAAVGVAGLPLLTLDVRTLTLGPLVSPRSIACFGCAARQWPHDAKPVDDPRARDIGLALLSLRLAAHVGDVVDNTLEQQIVRFDAGTASLVATSAHRLVDCPLCRPALLAPAEPSSTAFARRASLRQWVPFFHMNNQSRVDETARSAHLWSYTPGVRRTVAGAYKTYSRCAAEPAAESPSSAARLATALIGWSGSFRQGEDTMWLRATPSAGNLASQSLYLVADGVHYCHPDGHLRRIARAAAAARELDLACAAAPAAGAATYLVATAALARLESKYRERAYRLAFHDAGALAEGLRQLAPQFGLRAELTGDFLDDRIGALLRLGGVSEIVTFVARLVAAPAPHTIEEAA